MKTAKDLALISIFTALLIGVQLALSMLSGVELVTVLFLAFAFVFGIKRSLFVATAFSLLRCLLFGFFPTVILLYLLYYNLFAVVVGAIGNRVAHKLSGKIHLLLVGTAIALTFVFTLLDNVITPLFYGFSKQAALAYALTSLTALLPQLLCVTVTVSLLLPLLYKACSQMKK